MRAYIDRTAYSWEGRLDLGKLRVCFVLALTASPLVPALKLWRI